MRTHTLKNEKEKKKIVKEAKKKGTATYDLHKCTTLKALKGEGDLQRRLQLCKIGILLFFFSILKSQIFY